MKLRMLLPAGLLLTAALAGVGPGDARLGSAEEKDGFVALFNGKDLSGWVPVNGAPGTWKVADGEIVTTGVPTGYMRSEKMYENFVLELEWKHVKPKGNSGVFVWADALPALGTPYTRAIEVQVLDGVETKDYTSDGDLFSIHGATCVPDRPHPSGWQRCLPSEKRSKPAGQWNHYRVECNDGVIKLAVNGKVVSGVSKCSPRKGYLCLEAEGSECHFRNLKIKELPSTKPAAKDVAREAEGFVSLFNGLDLEGWQTTPELREHWRALPGPNKLVHDGKSSEKLGQLLTQKEYGDCEVQLDWRWAGKAVTRSVPVEVKGEKKTVEIQDAGRAAVLLPGKVAIDLWCLPGGSGAVRLPGGEAVLASEKADVTIGKWNRMLLTLQKRKLTVALNGKVVVDRAEVGKRAGQGAIGLTGAVPIEFANLFVRELK